MAGRSIWKGVIRLGSVEVPVKLHNAVKEERIQFHLLHDRDHARLRQQMVCAYEKTTVPPEEQVRGFEVEEGRYILIDPSELEQTEPEESRMIEIHEFVKTGQIDPVFLERVYYLEPEIRVKGYNAMVEALKEMDVEGICTWTMRKRSYVGALLARGRILRLHTLRYAHEVLSVKALEPQDISLSERELKAGIDLINQLTSPFQPERFEDEHELKLRDLIDRKSRGERIALREPKRLRPTSPDKLLETLESSLERVA